MFVVIWNISLGAVKIPFATIYQAIFHFDSSQFAHHIIVNQRMPRLYVAIVCGASLGLTGFQAQKLFQNPLVSATTLGVVSGASLFVVLAIYFFRADDTALFLPAILGAFLAGLCTFSLTKIISKSDVARGVHLVLSGSLVGLLLGSIKTFVLSIDPLGFQGIQDWLLGTINPSDFNGLKISYPAFILFALLLLSQSCSLDALMMGDSQATVLGANVKRIRFITIGSIFVLSALSVAVVGPIGFVGLVVPHIVKLFVNETGSRGALLAIIVGAIILAIADGIARVLIAPKLLLVGAVTSSLGGLFFLMLLFLRNKRL